MVMRKRKGRKLGSAKRRALLSRIRSYSYRAYLARRSGKVLAATRLEAQRDHSYAIAERSRLSGAASRAEESGQAMAERAYMRRA